MILIVSTAGPASEGTPEPGSAAPGEMPWVRRSAYETVETALADLDAIEQLPKDEMIGQYDAAVIDKEGGKPHVVKRTDRPRGRVIPEWFGGGTLPRKELHEAAEQLTADQAGSSRLANQPSKGARQGADQGRQSRESHRGGHDRRNHQQAAGSAQEVTLPEQSKAALSGAAFLVAVTQHRCLKTVDIRARRPGLTNSTGRRGGWAGCQPYRDSCRCDGFIAGVGSMDESRHRRQVLATVALRPW
jgi:hypothetical protein